MVDLLTPATLLCCLAICARLLTYRPDPGARHRQGIAWAAWLLIAATGGQALQILLLGQNIQVSGWQLVLLLILLVAIYRARGNLAHLFGGR